MLQRGSPDDPRRRQHLKWIILTHYQQRLVLKDTGSNQVVIGSSWIQQPENSILPIGAASNPVKSNWSLKLHLVSCRYLQQYCWSVVSCSRTSGFGPGDRGTHCMQGGSPPEHERYLVSQRCRQQSIQGRAACSRGSNPPRGKKRHLVSE